MYTDFKITKTTATHNKKTGDKTYVYYFTYKELSPRGFYTSRFSNNYKTEKRAILELNKFKTKHNIC